VQLPSFRAYALVGAFVAACSVYEVPPVASDPIGGQGGGGTSQGVGGNVPATGGVPQGAGTSSGKGGSLPSGGAVEPVPSGGQGGVGVAGGLGGAGGDSSAIGGAGGAGEGPDECPDDPDKTAPEVCGCGFPEAATALLGSCKTLISKLLHRYDFEGSGTTVTDRAGASHGVLMGGATLAKVAGRGVVQLGGGSTGSYVDLPNGLISTLSSATFEAWITWGGGNNYQRVFDFGDSDHATPENNPKSGKTYLFLSPKTGAGVVALGYSLTGSASGQEQDVEGSAPLPQALSQVVGVVDGSGDTLSVYVDGVQVATEAWTGALTSINDVNVWLGRSQYNADPELTATFHEFRVYGAALSAKEIATAFKAGTDPTFMPK